MNSFQDCFQFQSFVPRLKTSIKGPTWSDEASTMSASGKTPVQPGPPDCRGRTILWQKQNLLASSGLWPGEPDQTWDEGVLE